MTETTFPILDDPTVQAVRATFVEAGGTAPLFDALVTELPFHPEAFESDLKLLTDAGPNWRSKLDELKNLRRNETSGPVERMFAGTATAAPEAEA